MMSIIQLLCALLTATAKWREKEGEVGFVTGSSKSGKMDISPAVPRQAAVSTVVQVGCDDGAPSRVVAARLKTAEAAEFLGLI